MGLNVACIERPRLISPATQVTSGHSLAQEDSEYGIIREIIMLSYSQLSLSTILHVYLLPFV